MGEAPVGWYPVNGQPLEHYFDGTQWTGATRHPGAGTSPGVGTPPEPVGGEFEASEARGWLAIPAIGGIVMTAGGVWLTFAGPGGGWGKYSGTLVSIVGVIGVVFFGLATLCILVRSIRPARVKAGPAGITETLWPFKRLHVSW